MTRNIALLFLCGTVLLACSEPSNTVSESTENVAPAEKATPAAPADTAFDDAYSAAEAALAEAEANRNVWSKTENLLKLSKAANSEGRTGEAIDLANEAKIQAELAIAQAVGEKEAWRTRVLGE
jgi:hypothetical protein